VVNTIKVIPFRKIVIYAHSAEVLYRTAGKNRLIPARNSAIPRINWSAETNFRKIGIDHRLNGRIQEPGRNCDEAGGGVSVIVGELNGVVSHFLRREGHAGRDH